MKFSILISSFNKGKYLKKCITSCLNQEEKNFEVILFDNFSSDNTSTILKNYKKKIKIFKKKRISEFPAINQIDLIKDAFKKSRGEIICLLDADDYYNNKKLSVLKQNFLKRKKIDVIFDLPTKIYKMHKKKFVNKKKFQKDIWPTIIPTSGISCRRLFFKKFLNKGYLKNYQNLEIDFRLNVYARNLSKNFLINHDDLTNYRQVNNGIMSNIKKYSKKWWIKRLEAHNFMQKLFYKNNMKYKNSFDFLLTKILSK
tara:strand:- start:286 stop:1053 length:768 start_codon:yes stop_codon:yes gene_type:complete